jgi:hypothetical protein
MSERTDHRHNDITETFTYDDLSRLTASCVSGDTVSLVYQDNGIISSKSDLGEYSYDAAHPHAVTSVSCFDSMKYSMQAITYTAFNMADTIRQGDSLLVFTYGTDHSRKKSVTTTDSLETTRYYSGGYEKVVTLNQTKELHYITAYGRIVAIYNIDGVDSSMYYVHTDHAGYHLLPLIWPIPFGREILFWYLLTANKTNY